MDATDVVEQTLHVAREVSVYQIPSRPPSGWRSGEWLASAKIFGGRLRVISRGEECDIRLEDSNSDELFAVCPVPYGKRSVVVETVPDSSRYFVLRVEDPTTKRHAFLGLGFDQRPDAFDFNEALLRHEKWVERERAAAELGSVGSSAGGAGTLGVGGAQHQAALKEVQSLYKSHGDLGLKEGQTIHVNLKASAKPKEGGSLGGLGIGGSSPGGLFKIAPPPGQPAIPPPPGGFTPAAPIAQHRASKDPFEDVFGAPAFQQPLPAAPAAFAPAPSQPAGASPEGWATFD